MTLSLPVCPGQPVPLSRLSRAKRGFASRRITLPKAPRLIGGEVRPRPGDLVLARVEEIGHHTKLETPAGRRAQLYPGDEVLLVYGDRYAPDQFEATVPDDLGRCDLIAAGGLAGRVTRRAERARRPTRIQPLALVAQADGRVLSTRSFAIEAPAARRAGASVVAVLGSSMNAGKTTTMSSMIRGETQAGRSVAAAKVTGTGSGGDLWSYLDAGAEAALDFTDAGLPSTFRAGAAQIEAVFEHLLLALDQPETDLVAVEVADGLLFEETELLVRSLAFRQRVHGIVYAAADAMGALAGAEQIAGTGLNLLAVSGQVTRSPLALEEVRSRAPVPVLTIEEIETGRWLPSDVVRARRAA